MANGNGNKNKSTALMLPSDGNTSIAEVKNRYHDLMVFIKSVLKENVDYGIIPGTDKPTLYKPGAEKLRLLYRMSSNITRTDMHEDFEKDLYSYTYKCTIMDMNGVIVAQCEGCCSTQEAKYKYIWIKGEAPKDQKEANELKALKKGKWSKNDTEGWIWFNRVNNPDVASLRNTIMKMAQKRAFVGAVILASGASESFTQDMEDYVTSAENKQ